METNERAYRSAVRSLALREHSRKELLDKLRHKLGDFPGLEDVLDRLEREGLQSDRRFAEAYVSAKGRRLGPGRLAQELKLKGIPPELASECIGGLADEEQALANALAVLRKKFPPGRDGESDEPRQRRFLLGRGFSSGVARRAVATRDPAKAE